MAPKPGSASLDDTGTSFADYDEMDDDGMDEEEEFWADAEMNCHMHRDGQCGAAGSEYCDFECPFRDLP
jgi:hypothetical protein